MSLVLPECLRNNKIRYRRFNSVYFNTYAHTEKFKSLVKQGWELIAVEKRKFAREFSPMPQSNEDVKIDIYFRILNNIIFTDTLTGIPLGISRNFINFLIICNSKLIEDENQLAFEHKRGMTRSGNIVTRFV